jgi:uncharacterized protein (DUF302 family)
MNTGLAIIIGALLLSACATTSTPQSKSAGEYMASKEISVSAYGFDETDARLKSAFELYGLTVFAEIDHSAAASKVDLELGKNKLYVFGNPKAGTLLMQVSAQTGMDLPLKAHVFEEGDQTKLALSNIDAIALENDIPSDHPVIGKIRGLLGKISAEVTKK